MLRAAADEDAFERNDAVWILVADGTRLSARLWLPHGAARQPVPCILECIPYRKSDAMAGRDRQVHPFFARNGYAAVRLDLRGSGDSEGFLADEYSPQEHRDCLDVLAWIARQPWCNGRVGMMGISWGGFNALQVAALRPPELKAIVTVGSTDDRYADDVHYMGGCLLSANLTWAQTFFADLSRPPDPAVVGAAWRSMWMDRLENAHPLIERWLSHQTRDGYWKRGSVCESYGAIEVPVMAVGGWADSYTNSVLRLVGHLSAPRLGLIGPWGHNYPHLAVPGPRMAFLEEVLRWWDRWLKEMPNDVMREPLLRVWQEEALSADPGRTEAAGRWIGLAHWPPRTPAALRLFLGDGRLQPPEEPRQDLHLRHSSPETIGAAAGEWCAYGAWADLPADQRQDDGLSLCFDGPILDTAVDVFGAPVLDVEIASDRPQTILAARLNDVAPDGAVARVSYGVLNLSHRDGHEAPRLLVPGRRYRIRLTLNDVAYRFRAGHRIRLALSTSYWPTVWPSPERATITVRTRDGALLLPRLPECVEGPVVVPGAPAPPHDGITLLDRPSFSRKITDDLATGRRDVAVRVDHGTERIDDSGMRIGRLNEEIYSVEAGDPGSAALRTRWTMTMARDGWAVRTESGARMTATPTSFLVHVFLTAFEGESEVFARTWDFDVPRDHV